MIRYELDKDGPSLRDKTKNSFNKVDKPFRSSDHRGSMTRDQPYTVLLIEDNPGDVRLLREIISADQNCLFVLECVENLSTGLARLACGGVDVILLDLGLPDSRGFETFSKIRSAAPQLPVVVMTGLDDETLAVKAVQNGAQDYLVKWRIDGELLLHVLHYAIERHRLLVELHDLSFIDDLTGLYNRRGFFIFAKQYLNLANRTKKGMWLLFIDFDGLKKINDTLGHKDGDQALIDTATVLRQGFRESDIIARIGGDEFVVLAIGAHKNSREVLISGLKHQSEILNLRKKVRYKLSFSLGAAYYNPDVPSSIDELLIKADNSLYENKKRMQAK
jgi:two-component system cell cycle response regulator